MWVRGGGLLDDAAGVYGPDGVIFILEILITCSKLRFCVGFGGGAGFLDSTVGIDQIAGTVQISRNQTQVGISLLTESVNVEGVILDAVISLIPFWSRRCGSTSSGFRPGLRHRLSASLFS